MPKADSTGGPRELIRFVEITLGSLSELEYPLTLAGAVGVIGAEEHPCYGAR